MCITVPFNSDVLQQDLNNKYIQFFNARILRANRLVYDHLWVLNGKIISAEEVFFNQKIRADIRVDCQGLILSPGFIDVQLNGGFGVDFSSIDGSDEEYLAGIQKVATKLLSHGVTSFAPTLITSSADTYQRILPLLKRRNGDVNGAGILGAHLEGPFLADKKRGCHPLRHVSTFGDAAEQQIQKVYGSLENVAIVTLAPEKPGALDAIKHLTSQNVVVSLGHSAANITDGEAGVLAGASCITHLFNAMKSYHHRDPGLIGLLTSKKLREKKDNLYYGIISDGIHTHDSALRIAYKTHPEGLILVTDAIAALGMGDGRHQLGEQTIIVEGLQATLEGTETTAGSVASMPLCVNHLVKAAQCPLEDALLAATLKPAKLLNLNSKGHLGIGMDADLIIIDPKVQVMATFVGGRLVHT